MTAAHSKLSIAVGAMLLLNLGVLTAPAWSGDLYIGGTIGEVYKGDSVAGGFEPLGGACLGQIQALAMDDSFIYAGDVVGGVITFDVVTGEFLNLYFAPDGITAMVMHDGDLLISEASGEVHRVDPASGAIETTLVGPDGIHAMLVLGDDLYVSSALEGIVWKGNAFTGNFQYFGCGCSGPAQGLVSDESSIYAGDAFGQYVRYDLATGNLLDEGFFPFDISAMVRDGQDLLLSESAGVIHRVDPMTWQELDTLTSPISIQAMVMPESACPADCADGDGEVGIEDFLAALGTWGQVGAPCDLDGNGVGITDFLAILDSWGPCAP